MISTATDDANDRPTTLGTRSDEHATPTLALLCVAQFVLVLSFQSVAIALPVIQEGLGMSQSTLQWVITANELAFGGTLLLMGRATDLFGRQRMFIAGLALFGLASLVCGLSRVPAVLVAARAAQGLGAAIVTPAALAILSTTFTEGSRRNWALGIWGAVGPLGGTLGIVAGGVLAAKAGWPWIFFVSVPIVFFALTLASKVLENSPRHWKCPDSM